MNTEFWLMMVGIAVIGSILAGMVWGQLLRKHHSGWLRVVIGGALFMMLLYSVVIFPALTLTQISQDKDLNVLAMLPGATLLLLLIFSNALYRLPLIGGPLLAWALASARMQAARAQRQIQKLESIKAERRSLAKA